MEIWKHSLVWVLLCVGILWGEYGALQADSEEDQAMTFLNDKEAQVVRIANQSTVNEESTCDLVASCATECTRGACSPLRSDNLTCTTVAENTNCFTDPASKTGVCTNIKANFDRSYVRCALLDKYAIWYKTQHAYLSKRLLTPPIGSSGVNEEVPFEMQNSVCSQRRLDPLFKDLQELQNSSLYYFNFYFGSVDGTFRFYPGVEVKDCYGFDPRIRPWYTGAISVQKDLVVLLDSGFTMGNSLGLATFETTRFAAAQNATQNLVQTLTPNDRVTVFTFNGSAQAAPLSSSYIVPDNGLNISDPTFEQLLQSVDSPTTSNSNGLSSNFTAGLTEAVSALSHNSPSGAMKIVILFTDGGSSPSTSELVSVIENINNESIRLFIFDIGASISLNPALGNFAGQVGGLSEKLNNLELIQNPLFTLNSYFSFLVQSQRDTADGKRPFWQRVYADFGNLGNVITVAYPAMSSDGTRLIGVAGIDVQTDGLDLNFRNLLDSDLISFKRLDITINPLGVTFANSSPAYNDSLGQCSNSNPQLSPFCNKDDTTSTLQDLVCCADCGISSPHNSSGLSKTVVIVIVVCGVALLGLLVLSIFFWVRYRMPRTTPSGVEDFVKIPRYSYKTLSVATNKFSEENKLGSGTFGVVYRGTVPDGSKVAVKMLFHQPTHVLRDFEAEIRALATANHTNLVALKGFCVEQHHLLVYEFVENGDLDQWLFKKPEQDKKVLPWGGRVVIALGMAKGLAYLHEDLQNDQKVFHSDIKPANILLDSNFNPRIADFGMAMLYNGDSKLIASGGTPGYMAPEIRTGSPPTTKTDVYSYGMVVLEMVTGRKFSDPGIRNLPLWVAMNIVDKNESVLDPLLGDLEEDEDAMADRLLRIGLLCTSNDTETRPEMSAVIKMVERSLDVPSLPVFVEENDSMQELSNTFSTDTSSLSLARSRSGPSPISDTSSQGKTWTFSKTFKKLILRSGKSTPQDQSPSRSIERLPSTSSDQPGNSSNVLL